MSDEENSHVGHLGGSLLALACVPAQALAGLGSGELPVASGADQTLIEFNA